MQEFSPIPERSKLINVCNVMEEWEFPIVIDQETVKVCQKNLLGGGSTKQVYDITLNNYHFALALPNTNDDIETLITKWERVLFEPQTTDYLRNIGFLVNPISKIVPVKIGSVIFPAIIMARYQDINFGILDGRNNHSSTVKCNILPKPLNEETFLNFLQNGVPDLKKLIKNKIQLEGDSFNVGIVNSLPRVYLGDLGLPRYNFPNWNDEAYAKNYVNYFVNALKNGMWWKEYEANEIFFEKISHGSYNFRIAKELVDKILS